jgi:hypothetical protein
MAKRCVSFGFSSLRSENQTVDTVSQQLKMSHGLALMGHQNITRHHDTII